MMKITMTRQRSRCCFSFDVPISAAIVAIAMPPERSWRVTKYENQMILGVDVLLCTEHANKTKIAYEGMEWMNRRSWSGKEDRVWEISNESSLEALIKEGTN